MGRLFWIILGASDIIAKILTKGVQEKSESDRREVTEQKDRKKETEKAMLIAGKLQEDGHELRKVDGLWKLERSRQWILSQGFQKEPALSPP